MANDKKGKGKAVAPVIPPRIVNSNTATTSTANVVVVIEAVPSPQTMTDVLRDENGNAILQFDERGVS